MEKVLITGMAVLSSCGNTPEEFWQALSSGSSGIGPLTRIDGSRLINNLGGEVRGFDPGRYFGKEVDLMDRFAQFAVVCARGAMKDAGLPRRFEDNNGQPPQRVGVVLGSGLGGAESEDEGYLQLYGKNATRLHPFSIARMMHNAGTSQIAMDTGAQGPSFTISTACSSAAHAIGESWRMVRAGMVDIMLAGGSDAPLTYGVFRAWEAMRVLAPAAGYPQRACRPFSADRAGLVLAEGAAVFVLESESHARRRGARVYAELAGYGASSDAGHITQPSRDGAVRAMRMSMQQGGLNAEEIDYINAHGTATKLNDSTETAAVKQALGEQARQVSISSTKSMHGHAMGASGAIELAATLLAIQHQVVPPTANYSTPDPECDLDVTPNEARPRKIRAALSNSFAFGGLNAVLAVRMI